jgi:hypothetical protein
MNNDRLLTTLRKTLSRRTEGKARITLGQENSDSSFNVGFRVNGERLATAIYPAEKVATTTVKLTSGDLPNL